MPTSTHPLVAPPWQPCGASDCHGTLMVSRPLVVGSLRPGTVWVVTVCTWLPNQRVTVTEAGEVERFEATKAKSDGLLVEPWPEVTPPLKMLSTELSSVTPQ